MKLRVGELDRVLLSPFLLHLYSVSGLATYLAILSVYTQSELCTIRKYTLAITIVGNRINWATVEPLTKGQFGTSGFVLYKEVFHPKRLTFLYQKIIKIMMIMIIIETRV